MTSASEELSIVVLKPLFIKEMNEDTILNINGIPYISIDQSYNIHLTLKSESLEQSKATEINRLHQSALEALDREKRNLIEKYGDSMPQQNPVIEIEFVKQLDKLEFEVYECIGKMMETRTFVDSNVVVEPFKLRLPKIKWVSWYLKTFGSACQSAIKAYKIDQSRIAVTYALYTTKEEIKEMLKCQNHSVLSRSIKIAYKKVLLKLERKLQKANNGLCDPPSDGDTTSKTEIVRNRYKKITVAVNRLVSGFLKLLKAVSIYFFLLSKQNYRVVDSHPIAIRECCGPV